MFTVVWVFIANTVAVHVAGSKFKATEGHNVSMHFETGLERFDEAKIIFKGESKRKRLLAHYCSPASFPICDPIETPQHLQVEGGNVSMILLKVNISSSGLYTAQVITAANRVFEVNATLVVNQAPVSSSPAPPHSSSSQKPLSSSKIFWLYALIPVIIIIILCFCFWKLRKRSNTADDEEAATETPADSRSSVSTKNNN